MNKTRAKWPCMNNGVSSINENNVEIDMISSLPDDVLTHILSFMSTKEVVQTCILSKRWKNTWAAVPVLDIKQNNFLISVDHYCSGDCNEALRMSAARFERFMTGFLDNRAPTNMDRVCYVRRSSEIDASIGWLDRVALLRPLMIDIVIFSSNLIDMHDLVFSCSKLQHLSMNLGTIINNTIIKPVSINLPSLKFLELAWVELHDDFSQKLFMGCPSLERLKLCYCNLYFSGICSEVLKELTLHRCYICEQMQISCPALISLDMMIILKGFGISLKNMSSLVNVVIKLYGYFSNDVPVLNLFGGLSNVTNLELHLNISVFKDQVEKDIPNIRKFNNLRKLVVEGTWDMSYDVYLIACLLKHSPNLKELHLLLHENQGQIQETGQDVLFRYEYLETVKIGHVYGGELSSELINVMIRTLDSYVNKIGNLIIT